MKQSVFNNGGDNMFSVRNVVRLLLHKNNKKLSVKLFHAHSLSLSLSYSLSLSFLSLNVFYSQQVDCFFHSLSARDLICLLFHSVPATEEADINCNKYTQIHNNSSCYTCLSLFMLLEREVACKLSLLLLCLSSD